MVAARIKHRPYFDTTSFDTATRACEQVMLETGLTACPIQVVWGANTSVHMFSGVKILIEASFNLGNHGFHQGVPPQAQFPLNLLQGSNLLNKGPLKYDFNQ